MRLCPGYYRDIVRSFPPLSFLLHTAEIKKTFFFGGDGGGGGQQLLICVFEESIIAWWDYERRGHGKLQHNMTSPGSKLNCLKTDERRDLTHPALSTRSFARGRWQ